MPDTSPSQQIDAIIKQHPGWKGKALSQLRTLIQKADPGVVEEVKWKKPTNPSGVPVWSHDGIICTGGLLKNAVRLTFPKGSKLNDPGKLFNANLKGKSRAIDFHESDAIDEAGLKAIILEAIKLNTPKTHKGPR